jgi:hypothetical protein
MTDAINTITCGYFRVMPLAAGEYEITCSKLPEWVEVVRCSQREAGMLVVRLQDEYREELK